MPFAGNDTEPISVLCAGECRLIFSLNDNSHEDKLYGLYSWTLGHFWISRTSRFLLKCNFLFWTWLRSVKTWYWLVLYCRVNVVYMPICLILVVRYSMQLSAADKSTRINGFNDPRISDGIVVIDLVDACKPGSIDYDLVKSPSSDDQVGLFTLCRPISVWPRTLWPCHPQVTDWTVEVLLFCR